MKVLIKQPGKPYEFGEVENTLEAMQSIVGGYIQTVNLRCGLVLVCDEEGRWKNKTWNAVVKAHRGVQQIVGPFFVCKWTGPEFTGFEEDSPSANQLAAAFSCYEFGEDFRRKEEFT